MTPIAHFHPCRADVVEELPCVWIEAKRVFPPVDSPSEIADTVQRSREPEPCVQIVAVDRETRAKFAGGLIEASRMKQRATATQMFWRFRYVGSGCPEDTRRGRSRASHGD